MRDAPPVQLANYVKYIGTREGVEKIDESKLELPATMNQQKLIKQLICDIPFCIFFTINIDGCIFCNLH